MKPGRPIEANQAPDRARPEPLLLLAAFTGAIVAALIVRRLMTD
jgi:hypothetical protein